jgi:phospholipid/cholesterol/gamma-HCH transport system ATP-binding protein
LIELEGVHKIFDRPVLAGVDLVVPKGCLYALLGPPAAGKSLILKLVSGLARADRGRVRVNGRELGALPEIELADYRRGVGMVFQNNALFDFLTVRENVAFPLRRLFQLPEREIERRVGERLSRVGLEGLEARLPSELSGGQKKRVALARATVSGAPVVLYDEPAAGLDPVTSQRIFELLRAEHQAAGATAIMVSSDVDRLLSVADRVGMLHDGELVFDGTTAEARTTGNPVVRQYLDGLPEGPL